MKELATPNGKACTPKQSHLKATKICSIFRVIRYCGPV